jgi:hypothetical protein
MRPQLDPTSQHPSPSIQQVVGHRAIAHIDILGSQGKASFTQARSFWPIPTCTHPALRHLTRPVLPSCPHPCFQLGSLLVPLLAGHTAPKASPAFSNYISLPGVNPEDLLCCCCCCCACLEGLISCCATFCCCSCLLPCGRPRPGLQALNRNDGSVHDGRRSADVDVVTAHHGSVAIWISHLHTHQQIHQAGSVLGEGGLLQLPQAQADV